MKADLPRLEILLAHARQRMAHVPADTPGAQEAVYALCRRELEEIPMLPAECEEATQQPAAICGI